MPLAWAFPRGTIDKHDSSVLSFFQRHPACNAPSLRGPSHVVKRITDAGLGELKTSTKIKLNDRVPSLVCSAL